MNEVGTPELCDPIEAGVLVGDGFDGAGDGVDGVDDDAPDEPDDVDPLLDAPVDPPAVDVPPGAPEPGDVGVTGEVDVGAPGPLGGYVEFVVGGYAVAVVGG